MTEKREQHWNAASLAAGHCDWCGRPIDSDHDGWCPQTDEEIAAVGDAVQAEQRTIAGSVVESYNGPHPVRTANAEATIEAAMRYPVEWQEGYEDGYGDLSTGITYDDDPESDRSRAYDLGRNVGVLERVRKRIQDENVAYGDLYELQSLQAFIDPGDPELLEAAGVPEYTDENDPSEIECWLNLNGWGDAGYMERPAEQAAECERLRGYAECAVHAFDLATIDTDRNMRYVVHPFVSSEPYVNYCGLCALSSIDHTPGPDFVDPFDDVDEDGDAGCDVCGLESHPDHAQHEPDPDAMYDAARDEASEQARTDGRPDSWRDYMPGHPAWGRA